MAQETTKSLEAWTDEDRADWHLQHNFAGIALITFFGTRIFAKTQTLGMPYQIVAVGEMVITVFVLYYAGRMVLVKHKRTKYQVPELTTDGRYLIIGLLITAGYLLLLLGECLAPIAARWM